MYSSLLIRHSEILDRCALFVINPSFGILSLLICDATRYFFNNTVKRYITSENMWLLNFFPSHTHKLPRCHTQGWDRFFGDLPTVHDSETHHVRAHFFQPLLLCMPLLCSKSTGAKGPILTTWRDRLTARCVALSRQFPPIIFFHTICGLDSQESSQHAIISRCVARASYERQRSAMWYYWRGTCQHDPPFYGEQTAAASEPPSSNRWLRWVAPERDYPVFRHWRLLRTSQLAWLNQTNG